MIEDPPLLIIRRIARPDPDRLAPLRGLQTGYVVDALGGRGALDTAIKPLPGIAVPTGLVGPVVTCHCGPADNLALFAAVAEAQPGDIIVAATDAFAATSVTGDLLVGMAKNRGVAAIVTDGLVRDTAGIRGVGIPVFCRGVSPNSPARNGPGTVGEPVALGGVAVAAGDVAVLDEDGVVIVPRDRLDAVLARLPAIRAAEAELDAKVKAGLGVPGFVCTVLEGPRTKRVE